MHDCRASNRVFPAQTIACATAAVEPRPPAAFSPLAMMMSGLYFCFKDRQIRLDRLPSDIADDVTDKQNFYDGFPLALYDEAEESGRISHFLLHYFAYSTALVSRMTVTLICPG